MAAAQVEPRTVNPPYTYTSFSRARSNRLWQGTQSGT
jgi:hypothetical protein